MVTGEVTFHYQRSLKSPLGLIVGILKVKHSDKMCFSSWIDSQTLRCHTASFTTAPSFLVTIVPLIVATRMHLLVSFFVKLENIWERGPEPSWF